MINTILSGVISVGISVLDWFLTPVWNLIDNIDIGNNTIGNFVSSLNTLLNTLSGVIVWGIDATGLPSQLVVILFGIYLTSIVLRFSIYIVKAILRWWDKIVA